MEISFNVTALSRGSDGKSKVSVAACAVEKGKVFEGFTIFSKYLEMPYAQESISVESYIVKVLFRLSLELQEDVDRNGMTRIETLMLERVERKKRLVTLLLHALPTARNNRPATRSRVRVAGLFAAFTPTSVE